MNESRPQGQRITDRSVAPRAASSPPRRPVPLACQEQAARFATTRGDGLDLFARIRANGILDALALLRAGLPDSAHAVVMRSFEAQAHVLGLHLHVLEGGV